MRLSCALLLPLIRVLAKLGEINDGGGRPLFNIHLQHSLTDSGSFYHVRAVARQAMPFFLGRAESCLHEY